jgi:dihydrofolate reductase
MISIIVAVAEDGGIGRGNDLLWHLPEDLRRFRKLTMGKTVIMGKRTWESLPRKPLPGRRNIVITDDPLDSFDGAEAAYSIEGAIDLCESDNEAFVIGGGSIYRQFMPFADRLYITHINKKAPADVYFPAIDKETWKETEREDCIARDSNELSFSYVIYSRRSI